MAAPVWKLWPEYAWWLAWAEFSTALMSLTNWSCVGSALSLQMMKSGPRACAHQANCRDPRIAATRQMVDLTFLDTHTPSPKGPVFALQSSILSMEGWSVNPQQHQRTGWQGDHCKLHCRIGHKYTNMIHEAAGSRAYIDNMQQVQWEHKG